MKKVVSLTLLLVGIAIFISFSNPEIEKHETVSLWWAHSYGGLGCDAACSILQTSDGGYVMVGHYSVYSSGGYNDDLWIAKFNQNGSLEWNRLYNISTSSDEAATSIFQTSDGGYIVVGTADSDVWVIKLHSNGSVQWQKRYGTTEGDYGVAVLQASDGGYIVLSNIFQSGSCMICIFKLNSSGDMQWNFTYSGGLYDIATSIQRTQDGGYIVAGHSNSFSSGDYDILLFKTYENGSLQWAKTYGRSGHDYARGVKEAPNGGYIVVGDTSSYGPGNQSLFLMRIKEDGDYMWSYIYGHSGNDYGTAVQVTGDGHFIVGGSTEYPDSLNFWVMKLQSNGSVVWSKVYGGPGWEEAYSLALTSDGGYILSGETYSFAIGASDAWILKLNSTGGVLFNETTGAKVKDFAVVPLTPYPNLNVSTVSLSLGTLSFTVEDTSAVPVNLTSEVGTQADFNGDFDGDGLTDGEEVIIYHTDPLKKDTDNDGLNDNEEVLIYHTDPLLWDSDGDSLSDGYEVLNGLNPNNRDTDGDGFPDNIDIAPTNGFVPNVFIVAVIGGTVGVIVVVVLLRYRKKST